MKNVTLFLCILATFIFSGQCKSQETETLSEKNQTETKKNETTSGSDAQSALSPIIFIFDASGSMWDQIDGKTKMEIASEVLTKSVNDLPDDQKIGFVAYGHRAKGDCEDVEFLVDIENGTKQLVTQSLAGLKPLGNTPLAYSVMQVIDKLRSTKTKATIILVTDGNESCNGDLCEVVKAAKKEGIDFRLHIIGFGMKGSDTEQLQCSAIAGDGQYYDAADAAGLSEVLNQATTTTVDEPAGNLSLYSVVNGNAVDSYINIFKTGTKESVKSVRTYGDTVFVYLPAGTYDLKVNPLENSDISNVNITGVECFEEKVVHKTISFDGSKMTVNVTNNGEGWDAVVNIFEKGSNKSVASSRTYSKVIPFELNPGVYDIEITALVIEGKDRTHKIENVEVTGEGKNVEHNYQTGTALIGAKSGGELIDATVNIIDVSTGKSVASSRTYTKETSNPSKFILTTGDYEVTVKALKQNKGQIQKFNMTINGGDNFEKIVTY